MNGFGRGSEKEKKERTSVFTKETVGMTLMLFGAVVLLICITGPYLFGSIGLAIAAFFVGLFGFFAYPLLILLVYFSIVLTFGKKLLPTRWILRGALLLLAVFAIVHTATAERFAGNGYGAYLGGCWGAATEKLSAGTGGGLLLGIIVYPVRQLLSLAGAYVLFSLLMAFALYFVLLLTPLKKYLFPGYRERSQETRAIAFDDLPDGAPYTASETTSQPQPTYVPQPQPTYASQPQPTYGSQPQPTYGSQPRPTEETDPYKRSREILFRQDPASSYRNNGIYDPNSYFNQPRGGAAQPAPAPAPAPAPSYSPYPAYTSPAAPYAPPTPSYQAPQPMPAAPYAPPYSSQPTQPTPTAPYAPPTCASQPTQPAPDDYTPPTPSYQAPTPTAPAPAESYSEQFASAAEEMRPSIPKRIEEPSHPERETEYSSAPNVFDDPSPVPEEPPRRAFRDLYAPRTPAPAPTEEPTFETRREEPTFETRREEPTFETRREEPTFETRREEPTFETRREEPTFETRREEPTFETRREEPTCETRREEPTFDFRRDEPYEAEEARSAADLFDDDFAEAPSRGGRGLRAAEEAASKPAPRPAPPAPPKVIRPYTRPSPELFDSHDDSVIIPPEVIKETSDKIVAIFKGFNLDVEVIGVTTGAAFSRYNINKPNNVTIPQVTKYEQEVALRLQMPSVTMRPNNTFGAIAIEIPNARRAIVGIRSLIEAPEFRNANKPGSLIFALGKDVNGKNVYGDLKEAKHMLVAGATGTGKSVCLNTILISLIMKYSPKELRLILVDPKAVEFAIYEGLPHLMINEIIKDAPKTIMALNWLIKEMERRFALFAARTAETERAIRDLEDYHASLSPEEFEEKRLPKIVMLIDEFGDLMLVAKKEIEDKVLRIAQKARAAGIHLILATQRPSAEVISGVIKSNLNAQIAFRVNKAVDSQIILGQNGAEKLLGNGDMIFKSEKFPELRIQGAYISSDEVQNVISFIKRNNDSEFDQSVSEFVNSTESSSGADQIGGASGDSNERPPDNYIKALAIAVRLGSMSYSLVQRKLGVGYAHAGKIVDWMESKKYISEFDGKAKARTVLLSKEEFEATYGSLDQWER